MTLSPAWLDELRARTLLSAVIAPSVKLLKAGREHKACCPFHSEKTPSFTVNDEKGFYHCFGCGAHGDAIRFLTDARGLPFMEAVKELAAKAGMEVPAVDSKAREKAEKSAGLHEVMEAANRWFIEQLEGLEGSEARKYLKERGISDATRKKFGFGFAPDSRGKLKKALENFGIDKLVDAGLLISTEEKKEPYDRFRGRLTYPIKDQRGRVIAFSARILGPGEPKYLNSPDTPLFDKGRTLFNLDLASPASRTAKRILVVEGQMDVIALDQAGIGEVVAPLGTALTEAQLERLWRLDPAPICCFDGDSAGQKAAIRAALRALPHLAPERTLSFSVLPTGKDPDDLIKAEGRKAFEKIVQSAQPFGEFLFAREAEQAVLDTPEGRAGFGKRLRDLAKQVNDPEVRTQYLALFTGLLSEMFDNLKRGHGFVAESVKFHRRPIAPEMLAIARLGMTQAVEVRVILLGLTRYPALLSELAEPLASIWIKDRKLSLLREAMLTSALQRWPLTTSLLEEDIRAEGHAGTLEGLRKPFELRYSFLHGEDVSNQGRHDLMSVMEVLTAGAHVNDAILQAQERYANAEDHEKDGAYDDLQRLIAIRTQNSERFRSYRSHGSSAEEMS